jgi:hypothetical protein
VALVLAGCPPELVEIMLWFGWELEKTMMGEISEKRPGDHPEEPFYTPPLS